MADTEHGSARQRGATTRERAERVALRLFTEQGYEATSLRQIADELGINKASLYYYFDGKEAILQSVLERRGDEAEALLKWVREQPADPDVLREAVLRWVASFTAEKLQGIRFLAANPLVLDRTQASRPRVGAGLSDLADALAGLLPVRSDENVVLLRMGLLSINAAVQAAANSSVEDAAITGAATRAAAALVELATASSCPTNPEDQATRP